MRFCLAVFLFGAFACDPGWEYQPTSSPTPATSAAVRVQLNRVSLFAGSVSATLILENETQTELVIDSTWFSMVDARGEHLPLIGVAVCGSTGAAAIQRAHSCEVVASYGVNPFGGFFRYNHRLQSLTFVISKRGPEGAVNDSFPLTWKL